MMDLPDSYNKAKIGPWTSYLIDLPDCYNKAKIWPWASHFNSENTKYLNF